MFEYGFKRIVEPMWTGHYENSQCDSYRTFNNGKTAVMTINCPGLSQEDITLSLERKNALAYLRVKGSRAGENDSFYKLNVSKCLGKDKIEKVRYNCKNGVLTVRIDFDLQDLEKVKVEPVDDLKLN